MTRVNDLARALGVSKLPARWESIWDEAMAHGAPFLEEAWLRELAEQYPVLTFSLDAAISAAAEIREDAPMRRFVTLLAYANCQRDVVLKDLAELELPADDCNARRMAPYLATLPAIPAMVERYRARNIPEDVLADTIHGCEDSLRAYKRRFGELGMNMTYLGWNQHYYRNDLLRIGRLNFEISHATGGHAAMFRSRAGEIRLLAVNGRFDREGFVLGSVCHTDEDGAFDADYRESEAAYAGYLINDRGVVIRTRVTLARPGWEKVLSPEDASISVHIPAGPGLTPEAVGACIGRAREIVAACYADYDVRGFRCGSWLMDPVLGDILGEDSNITRFQRLFARCPSYTNGQGVFSFLFPKKVERYEDLPENSRLERAVKKLYLDGGAIHELRGLFL